MGLIIGYNNPYTCYGCTSIVHPSPSSSIPVHPQTGSLPNSIVDIASLTSYNSLLDFRLNFMCCCGVGPLIHDQYWLNVRCGD